MRKNHFTVGVAVHIALLLMATTAGFADGLRDNDPAHVRPIPPMGNALSPADRAALTAGMEALGKQIDELSLALKDKPALLDHLPDVQIYFNAVRYPLVYHETIDPAEGMKALSEGMQRAEQLREGKMPWLTITSARGFVSRLDGSVQPYVLSVPTDFKPSEKGKKYRLDIWSHGRDELLTELRFIEQDDLLHEMRYLHQPLEPTGKFYLSTYGRYITAWRFAGEVDGLEALDAVQRAYPIDENRILQIGFSLGGTASWEYGCHFADRWAAAAPGAGLADTREFLKGFQHEDVSGAPWYQQTLWHLYDSTDWVENLANLPTIAYAGELDPQKQAGDIILKAAAAEHVKIDRITGTATGHRYDLDSKLELDSRLDDILAEGRNPLPPTIRFTTWTLRYNRMYWVTVDGLQHHWQHARVAGQLGVGPDGIIRGISLKTQNVTGVTISFPAGTMLDDAGLALSIDGQGVNAPQVRKTGGYTAGFVRDTDGWRLAHPRFDAPPKLHKKHGLQGPIDDAFMDRFMIVRPTGKAFNEKTGAWETAECQHAIDQWRQQFRGEAIVKNDVDVNDADIAACNLILFGDPSSNRLLGKCSVKLPIGWTADAVTLGDRKFPANLCAAVLIYPNPLNPARYIVVNSGFTYREYDYLNNARQTPKLPDYAVIDVSTPATSQTPGGVSAAGFFDEEWQLQADDGMAAVGWAGKINAEKPASR